MPSDTIYGLSARALDEQAVERLHRLKSREANKPFIILVADSQQAEILGIPKQELAPAFKYWPAALSIICRDERAPAWLQRGTKSLAVRLPDSKKLRDLIKKVGPIISTSANISGEPPMTNCKEAVEVFGDALDFYVDVGEIRYHKPSTLVKFTNSGAEIIRQGAVTIEEGENK